MNYKLVLRVTGFSLLLEAVCLLLPMFVSLIGSCALRLVWVWTVFAMFPSPEILYISYPITWILTASAHYVCCFITLRKRLRQEAA